MMDDNLRIAHAWVAAFNAHDLDGLLALYAADACHFSPKLQARHPETRGMIQGHDALRAWWEDAFRRLPSLQYRAIGHTADGQRVFIEYMRQVEGEPDLRVGELLAVREGLIHESRVYHG